MEGRVPGGGDLEIDDPPPSLASIATAGVHQSIPSTISLPRAREPGHTPPSRSLGFLGLWRLKAEGREWKEARGC